MSLLPRRTARSRSWCTSWKSRVARAVATTTVGVTWITSSGSGRPRPVAVPASPAGQVVVDPHELPGPASRSDLLRLGHRVSSAITRTPSVSSTSAITIGSRLPGTGGWWCTT